MALASITACSLNPSATLGDVTVTFIVSSGLSFTPGAIAKDSKTSAKEKEACLAFVDAEGRLDKEDCGFHLSTANQPTKIAVKPLL